MYIDRTQLGHYVKNCPITMGVHSSLNFMDDEYYVPEAQDVYSMVEGYLIRLEELNIHYTPNLFDCDGFAKALAAFASLQAVEDGIVRAPWPCALLSGFATEGPHAMNMFLVRKEVNGKEIVEWILVEAQTGEVYAQEIMASVLSHVSMTVF